METLQVGWRKTQPLPRPRSRELDLSACLFYNRLQSTSRCSPSLCITAAELYIRELMRSYHG